MPKKIKKYLKGAWDVVADGCLVAFQLEYQKAKMKEKSEPEPSRGISVLNEMIERNNVREGLHRRNTVPDFTVVVEEDDERPAIPNRRHTEEYVHRRRRKTSHPREDSAREPSPLLPVPPIPDKYITQTAATEKEECQRAKAQARIKETAEQDAIIQGMRDKMHNKWKKADRKEKRERKDGERGLGCEHGRREGGVETTPRNQIRERNEGEVRDRDVVRGSNGDAERASQRDVERQRKEKDSREKTIRKDLERKHQQEQKDAKENAARIARMEADKAAVAEYDRRKAAAALKDKERQENERKETERRLRSPAQPPLSKSDPWQKVWDAPKNAYYFYNRHTGISQWDDPYAAPAHARSVGAVPQAAGISPRVSARLTPLTVENLAMVKGGFVEDQLSEMDRGLGDMNRTYLEGMVSPQDLEDKNETDRKEVAREKAERAKSAKVRAEKERVEREKVENARLAKEKIEKEKIDRENAEKAKVAKAKAEKKRLEREEAERKKAELKRQQPITVLHRGIGVMNRTYLEGMITPEQQAAMENEARMQQPATALDRGVGDMTRTVIEGMVSPEQKEKMDAEGDSATVLERPLGDMMRTYIEGLIHPDDTAKQQKQGKNQGGRR